MGSEFEIKSEYNKWLSLGEEFNEMFPTLTGEWVKDKKEFTKMYNLNEDLNES